MVEHIKIPTPAGEVEAEVVNVISCNEVAVECKLSDGVTLQIRPVITGVAKATQDGKTNYFVRIQNVIERNQ